MLLSDFSLLEIRHPLITHGRNPPWHTHVLHPLQESWNSKVCTVFARESRPHFLRLVLREKMTVVAVVVTLIVLVILAIFGYYVARD